MSGPTFYRDFERWMASSEQASPLASLDRETFRRWLSRLGLLLLLAALVLWQRTQVVKVGYEVGALRSQRNELRSRTQRLQAQLDDLRSMPTAERVARQSLGMVNADPARVIYLEEPAGEGFTPGALWTRMRRALDH